MPLQRSLFELLLMIFGWTDLRLERRRRRLALLRLTDEQLKDIGLSRGEIDGWIDRLDPLSRTLPHPFTPDTRPAADRWADADSPRRRR